MKKVLFVLAFVAVYGVSLAMVQSTPMVSVDETIVVVDDKVEKEEGKKAKAKGDAKACSGSKDAKACSGDKAAKSDCASKCSGEKTAKKSDCSKSCSGKK
jgi:hypothetical protein